MEKKQLPNSGTNPAGQPSRYRYVRQFGQVPAPADVEGPVFDGSAPGPVVAPIVDRMGVSLEK